VKAAIRVRAPVTAPPFSVKTMNTPTPIERLQALTSLMTDSPALFAALPMLAQGSIKAERRTLEVQRAASRPTTPPQGRSIDGTITPNPQSWLEKLQETERRLSAHVDAAPSPSIQAQQLALHDDFWTELRADLPSVLPTKVNYVARDANGRWWWYENAPTVDGSSWIPVHGVHGRVKKTVRQRQLDRFGPLDWRATLISAPASAQLTEANFWSRLKSLVTEFTPAVVVRDDDGQWYAYNKDADIRTGSFSWVLGSIPGARARALNDVALLQYLRRYNPQPWQLSRLTAPAVTEKPTPDEGDAFWKDLRGVCSFTPAFVARDHSGYWYAYDVRPTRGGLWWENATDSGMQKIHGAALLRYLERYNTHPWELSLLTAPATPKPTETGPVDPVAEYWKNIPAKYNYIARDADDRWFAYPERPSVPTAEQIRNNTFGINRERWYAFRSPETVKDYLEVATPSWALPQTPWKETLHVRPGHIERSTILTTPATQPAPTPTTFSMQWLDPAKELPDQDHPEGVLVTEVNRRGQRRVCRRQYTKASGFRRDMMFGGADEPQVVAWTFLPAPYGADKATLPANTIRRFR